MLTKKPKYNLEKRTQDFSIKLIKFCVKVQKNVVTIPIIRQLIKSGTSIGANYREANGASSKKDFRNKIFICKKEAKETEYWLLILSPVINNKKVLDICNNLALESKEYVLIFSKIASSLKIKN